MMVTPLVQLVMYEDRYAYYRSRVLDHQFSPDSLLGDELAREFALSDPTPWLDYRRWESAHQILVLRGEGYHVPAHPEDPRRPILVTSRALYALYETLLIQAGQILSSPERVPVLLQNKDLLEVEGPVPSELGEQFPFGVVKGWENPSIQSAGGAVITEVSDVKPSRIIQSALGHLVG